MQKQYRLYQVDSFTKEKLTGNPAGVVTNADGLTEKQMQQIARELNNSETAFILPPQDATHDVWVRFFTPTKEVPICGHATIAAHYARAKELCLPSTRVLHKTGAGVLPVDIVKTDGDYQIIMTQGKPDVSAALSGATEQNILAALGLAQADRLADFPIAIASTGHAKVMIGIQSTETLHRLTPDMTRLARLSDEIGCNGYYVFTCSPQETPMVHGRMFAPAIGINEDPVTGNANGPLGAYLIHYGLAESHERLFTFQVMQGEAIGRAGTMEVQVTVRDQKPDEVRIIGDAVIAFSTVLTV